MVAEWLGYVNEHLTLFLIAPAILLLGLYLTARLGPLPLTKLWRGCSHLLKGEEGEKGSISNYQAISTVLAGNLGTGNISGMAVALTMGGPGAIVWMWVMGFFGALIKYAGVLLGIKYREVNSAGEYVGGPMYYIEKGLQLPSVAILFSLFAILSAFTVGNIVQVNSVTLPLTLLGWNPFYLGVVIAVFIALLLLGGVAAVGRVASAIVPLMAIIYLSAALVILFIHHEALIPALQLIASSAFSWDSAVGAAAGYTFFQAVAVGFQRGVFATDAGVGIAPILQAAAKTRNGVEEGLVAMVAPIVVLIICTITTLVLLVTGAWKVEGLESTNMCIWAFREGSGHWITGEIVLFSLLLFAFTTILAWAYCAEKAAEYLFGKKGVVWVMFFYILLIPLGTLLKVDLVWKLADSCIMGMLLCNLFALFALSSVVVEESR